jgi:hypothetical protein
MILCSFHGKARECIKCHELQLHGDNIMMPTTIRSLSLVLATAVVFTAGLMVGRHFKPTSAYDTLTSPSEAPLLGRWKISNAGSLRSTIELRRDRTAIMYNGQQHECFVSIWGRNGDQLWLQNFHISAEPTSFVPPSTLKIVQLQENQARLQTEDKLDWNLSRM